MCFKVGRCRYLKKNSLTINKTIQRVYIKDKDKNISKVIITTPKTKNANREIPNK